MGDHSFVFRNGGGGGWEPSTGWAGLCEAGTERWSNLLRGAAWDSLRAGLRPVAPFHSACGRSCPAGAPFLPKKWRKEGQGGGVSSPLEPPSLV